MYTLTARVDAATDGIYNEVVRNIFTNNYDLCATQPPKNITEIIYVSVDCIINEMIRKLGILLGPDYVTYDSLTYWKTVMKQGEFYQQYAIYIEEVNKRGCQKADVYRPTISIFATNEDEYGELGDMGIGVQSTTASKDVEVTRLCYNCGCFKPMTHLYFGDTAMHHFTSDQYNDIVTVGICTECEV